jgi:hypothetical protein
MSPTAGDALSSGTGTIIPRGARSKSRTERIVDLHEAVTLAAVSAYVMSERPADATSPLTARSYRASCAMCSPPPKFLASALLSDVTMFHAARPFSHEPYGVPGFGRGRACAPFCDRSDSHRTLGRASYAAPLKIRTSIGNHFSAWANRHCRRAALEVIGPPFAAVVRYRTPCPKAGRWSPSCLFPQQNLSVTSPDDGRSVARWG